MKALHLEKSEVCSGRAEEEKSKTVTVKREPKKTATILSFKFFAV